MKTIEVRGFTTLPKDQMTRIEGIFRSRPRCYSHGEGKAHVHHPFKVDDAEVLRKEFQKICEKNVLLVENDKGFIFHLCTN